MVLVKICGITNIDDALDAIEFGADAIGFNFYPDSPRHVDPVVAETIIADIPGSIWKVGVFVEEQEDMVREISQFCELDFLQFHGDETPEYCSQFATPHWKAFRLRDESSVELMKKYKCDYYLIDAYVEKVYGGTGIVGNWELAAKAKKVGKIFLAGGLNPENIEMAVAVVKPDGVDVCSGVESEPGRKDRYKLEEFITKAKSVVGGGL